MSKQYLAPLSSLYMRLYVCVCIHVDYILILVLGIGSLLIRLLCYLSSASSPNPLLEGSVHPGTYLKDFT